MVTQLDYADTGFLAIPASTATIGSGGGGGTVDATKTVEAHGAIAELTATNLETLFPNEDDAQPGDLIWVGTAPNEVLYRMRQGTTNAQLAASWARDTSQAIDAIIDGAPERADTLKELYDIIQGDHTQPQLVTYNAATLTSATLEYSHIYFVDLRGTTATERLTLQLPGPETTDLRMDIVIRDLPSDTFKDGYLSIEALPNGADPVQILTPQGLTTDSIANVSAFDLRGSEIYLARTRNSNLWLINIRLESASKSEIWTGTLASPPDPALYRIWLPNDASPGTLKYWSAAEDIWRDA